VVKEKISSFDFSLEINLKNGKSTFQTRSKRDYIFQCTILVRVEFPDYTGEKVETASDNTYL
jgi:hypothetical protein